MKKFQTAVALLLVLISIAFVSCTKDDKDEQPEPSPRSYLVYEGNKYELSKGFVEWMGSNSGGGYITQFGVYSNTYNIIGNGDTLKGLEGNGNLLNLLFVIDDFHTILPGIYEYNLSLQPGMIIFGKWGIGYDYEQDLGYYAEITSGTFTYSVGAENPVLIFNMQDENGKTVQGEFSEGFQYFDAHLMK